MKGYSVLPEALIELAKQVREKKAESQRIEVKSAHKGCPKLYETLSGFSNQDDGGIILFGLDESNDFTPVGVYDLQNLQKKVSEQCKEMEPAVRAVLTDVEWEGVTICAAEIPGIDLLLRPCYYKGSGIDKGSFIRVGEADEHMTAYEIYALTAFQQQIHDDERPVMKAGRSALDAEQIGEYIRKREEGKPKFAMLSEAEKEKTLTVFDEEGHPSLAALMNFGIFPQSYFPGFSITAVVIPGKNRGDIDSSNARFTDNARIEGTIGDMTAEALEFCARNMKKSTVVDRRTGERKDRMEYPLVALREAILNAVIHRDYSAHTEGTPVQIEMFADRIEIHSPGALYGRMTVEQLGNARPNLRNPVLAVMAEVQTNTENRYSGIPTMRREMEAAGLPPPIFRNNRNEFVVIFRNEILQKEILPDGADELLAFCRVPRTRQEIAEFLGIRTVSYAMNVYVSPLIEKGMLKMTLPANPRSRKQKYYSK